MIRIAMNKRTSKYPHHQEEESGGPAPYIWMRGIAIAQNLPAEVKEQSIGFDEQRRAEPRNEAAH